MAILKCKKASLPKSVLKTVKVNKAVRGCVYYSVHLYIDYTSYHHAVCNDLLSLLFIYRSIKLLIHISSTNFMVYYEGMFCTSHKLELA